MKQIFAAGLICAMSGALPMCAHAQTPLEAYFPGKQVVVKMDMPGSQKGVDLHFDKPSAMDWNDYSSRLKTYGVALHKGDVARITKFVVKKDMMEFQLDGGGFGTAGDDSSTTVSSTYIQKSQYEKDLEKRVSETKDDSKRRDLQHDLDRERSRRERAQSQNDADAKIASQMKAEQVGQKRLQGGSRFNLRWKDAIPSDDRSPDAVMHLLAEYVDFNTANAAPMNNGAQAGYGQSAYPQGGYAPPQSAGNPSMAYGGASATQIHRGMKMDEVSGLFGQGRPVSHSVSNDGLNTQVMEYRIGDSVADVTYVEGVVVKYSVQSQ